MNYRLKIVGSHLQNQEIWRDLVSTEVRSHPLSRRFDHPIQAGLQVMELCSDSPYALTQYVQLAQTPKGAQIKALDASKVLCGV